MTPYLLMQVLGMGQKNYYVVFIGRVLGIYELWEDCHEQVYGYPSNCYNGYKIVNDAVEAYEQYFGQKSIKFKEEGSSSNLPRQRNTSQQNQLVTINFTQQLEIGSEHRVSSIVTGGSENNTIMSHVSIEEVFAMGCLIRALASSIAE